MLKETKITMQINFKKLCRFKSSSSYVLRSSTLASVAPVCQSQDILHFAFNVVLCVVNIVFFFFLSSLPCGKVGGWNCPKYLAGVYGTFLDTSTLFQAKIFDFSYPFLYLPKIDTIFNFRPPTSIRVSNAYLNQPRMPTVCV